jgi:hypothetical protein
MRLVEQTYGTNHFVTKSAYQEVLCTQAPEEAKAHDVPIYVAMGRLAHKLAKLEKKLAHQGDFMQQAKDEFEQAEKRMADLAATTADIEADIRATEAERDELLANTVPIEKRLLEAGSAGITALNLFVEGAIGVVGPAIMLKLRDEIVAIARQIQAGTRAFTPLSAASEATEASPVLSGATTPSGPQDNSCMAIKGANQAWAKTKDELTAEYNRTTQQLQQAKSTSLLAKHAHTEATTVWTTAGSNDPRLEEAVQASAKSAATSAAAELEAYGAETSAREACQLHKNQGKGGPYGRN